MAATGGNKRQMVTSLIALVAVIGLVMGGVYGYRALWGSEVGGKCEENNSCKPGAICISKRCRRSCSKDADCQPGWSCRGAAVLVSNSHGGDIKSDTVNICYSPESMASSLEAKMNMIMKKKDVRVSIIVKQMMAPQKMTDAQFDAAWERIPPAERSSATVEALAARALQLAAAP